MRSDHDKLAITVHMGACLRRARSDRRVSRRALAEAAGVCKSRLFYWETGRVEMTWHVAMRLCVALGVGIECLIGASATNADVKWHAHPKHRFTMPRRRRT